MWGYHSLKRLGNDSFIPLSQSHPELTASFLVLLNNLVKHNCSIILDLDTAVYSRILATLHRCLFQNEYVVNESVKVLEHLVTYCLEGVVSGNERALHHFTCHSHLYSGILVVLFENTLKSNYPGYDPLLGLILLNQEVRLLLPPPLVSFSL